MNSYFKKVTLLGVFIFTSFNFNTWAAPKSVDQSFTTLTSSGHTESHVFNDPGLLSTHIIKDKEGHVTHVILQGLNTRERSRTVKGRFVDTGVWARKVFKLGSDRVPIKDDQLSGNFAEPFDKKRSPEFQVHELVEKPNFGQADNSFKLIQKNPGDFKIPESFHAVLKAE